MILLLSANWAFGITELISTISAVLTFLAICTSLYLAQKSKTLKVKILGSKINNQALLENQYQRIEILNTGHIKFTCSCVGYQIGRNSYYAEYMSGTKKLDQTRIEKLGYGTSHVTQDTLILPTYLHEGDLLQVDLYPADFNFQNELKNKKVYVFAMINGKMYKKSVGIRAKKFKKYLEENGFEKTSRLSNGKNSVNPLNIKNEYLR